MSSRKLKGRFHFVLKLQTKKIKVLEEKRREIKFKSDQRNRDSQSSVSPSRWTRWAGPPLAPSFDLLSC